VEGKGEMAVGRTNKTEENRILDKRESQSCKRNEGKEGRKKETMFPALWRLPMLV
jgi:hypothetical protein